MRGKVLFILNPKHGPATARIRGTIYESVLRADNWDVTYVSISSVASNPEFDIYKKTNSEIFEMAGGYDIIYLLKINSYGFVRKLRARTKARLIFDLTDALWRPAFRKSWLFLEEIMLLCDAVFTENVIATAYAAQYNTCIVRLAACTQTEKFDEIRAVVQKRADDKVVVGWIGSDSTINAIYSIAPQLERLGAKFPQVEFRLLINGKIKLDERLRSIRYSTLTNYSEADMIREALTMDIGIFPPPSDLRDYEIRGALKAMIYMSAGVPAVCLNAGDAARIISDGENGMLVDHPDEWVSKIEALILNPALRESMGAKALGYIRTDHSLTAVGSALSRGLQTVLAQSNELKSGFSIFRKLQILFRSFVDN